jgi:hypothetical protein
MILALALLRRLARGYVTRYLALQHPRYRAGDFLEAESLCGGRVSAYTPQDTSS